MKLAICDDDKKDLGVIKDYVHKFDDSLDYDEFHSADALLQALKKTEYDMIFLDIEMEPISGFEAAQRIMEKTEKPLIVFVTNSSKYTIQGYEVAFRYLMKPVTYEQVEKVMRAALERIVPKKIMIDVNGKNFMISTRDIYYIEVFDHNVRIRTPNDYYDYRESLKNLEEMLTGGTFVRPHNSYLVNLEHVISTTQSELIMRDNHKINISRKRKDHIFKALHQFIRR